MSNVKFKPTTFGEITAPKIVNMPAPGVKETQTFPNPPNNNAIDEVCFNKSNPLDNSTVFPIVLLPQLQRYASQGNPPQGPSIGSVAKNLFGTLLGPKEDFESTMCLANAC